MTRIRAVGFDLDGTLFDHIGSATEGLNAFLPLIGVQPTDAVRELWFETEEECHTLWKSGQISFQGQRRLRLQRFLPAVGVAAPDTAEGLDDLFVAYLREYRAAWRALSDAESVLATLRARGIRVGILTNGNQDQQVDKLRTIGLDRLVDVVCTAEALGIWKPDIRAFAILAEQLGVAPAECLFVGDHPDQDIAGAVAAGMPALLVDHYGADSIGLSLVMDRTRED